MAKKSKNYNSFSDFNENLPSNFRPKETEKFPQNKYFKKDKERLHADLVLAKNRNNKKKELITLTKLGKLHLNNGFFTEAIKLYEQAYKIDKEDAYVLDGLGLTYHKMGDFDQAIKYFKLQLDPVIAMTNLSRAYQAKGDYTSAMEYAQQVLRKEPENSYAMNQLGVLYRITRQYDKSIEYFENNIDNHPQNKQSWDGLGITYREMHNYEKALECFEKKLNFDPKDKQAWDGLGITYREMHNNEKALECFEKKLNFDHKDKQAWDGLGITYREMHNYEKSIECFQKNLEFDVHDKQAWDGLGITYREMHNYEKSIECFQKNLEFDHKDKQAWNGLGITYREMQDYENAIESFQKQLEFYPMGKYALFGLGITYREMGNFEKAIETFEKFLEIEPQNSFIKEELVKIYKNLDTSLQSIQLLKRRLLSYSDDVHAEDRLQELAKAMENEGKYQDAKDAYEFLKEIRSKAAFLDKSMYSGESGEHESMEEKIRRMENKLEHQQAEIMRSWQMSTLGLMASGLAHEIAQPLQIMMATTQNCQLDIQENAIDSTGILNDLEKVFQSIRRVDHVVNHLQVLSREQRPKAVAVQVNEIVNSSLIMFSEQLKNRNIKINLMLDESIPSILADDIQLELVFINLINNARDALEKNDTPQISITTESEGKEVSVKFSDNGTGILPEILPKVFNALFSTKEKGNGLGLFISRDIIRSYGGQITAESNHDEGATFIIGFPIFQTEMSS